MRRRIVMLIARREFLERTRTTGFRVTTAFGALLITGLFFLPAIIDAVANSSGKTIAVVDRDRSLTSAMQSGLPGELPNGKPEIVLRAVSGESTGRGLLDDGAVDGVLIPGDVRDPAARARYVAKSPGAEADRLRAALARANAFARLRAAGLSTAQIESVFAAPALRETATEGRRPSDASRALVYVLLLMLYLTVLLYGANLATGIIQEKASRVTELMVAAVSSLEHMTGKIVGVGLVGLVQYGVWLTAAAIVLLVKALLGDGGPDLAGVGPGTFALFLVFFVLGYVLYGTLYAALSAPASRPEDGTVLGQPLMLTLIIGFAISFTAINDPDGQVVTIASLVPPVSPMVMFTRAALGSPPAWQVALNIVILLVTIVLTVRVLAKVYRVGILLYGKKPTPREVLRMMRAA